MKNLEKQREIFILTEEIELDIFREVKIIEFTTGHVFPHGFGIV